MRKKIWVIAAAVIVVAGALGIVAFRTLQAQGRRSPHESVSATIDGAKVTIVYGRPYMRGRTIFGGLVPWDVVWCPGADEATTLEASKEIQISTLRIPPGPHTIWVLPRRDRWTLIVSEEPSGFHTRYDSQADMGRVEFPTSPLPAPVEQLTFAIDPNPAGGGKIAMAWERTEASVPFRVVQ